MVERNGRLRLVVCIAAALALRVVGPLEALTPDELKRYGFSSGFTQSVQESERYVRPDKPFSPKRIPSPMVPRIRKRSAVPSVPSKHPRVLYQEGRPTPSKEGPTEVYRSAKAKRIEGTFREVEDFFFRPTQIHKPFQSLSGAGLTGLVDGVSGEVPKKGWMAIRSGAEFTEFIDSFGKRLLPEQKIHQWVFPQTFSTVPIDDLEASVQLVLGNEESDGFPMPLPTDYTIAGVRNVSAQVKYRFLHNPSRRLSLAVGMGVDTAYEKSVTRLGSNGVDYSMFLAATRRRKNFGVHVTGGVIFANGEDQTNSGVPDIGFYNLGLDFMPSSKWDALVEIAYKDRAWTGRSMDAILGLKYKVSSKWIVDLAVPISLDNTLPQGYKSRLILRGQLLL